MVVGFVVKGERRALGFAVRGSVCQAPFMGDNVKGKDMKFYSEISVVRNEFEGVNDHLYYYSYVLRREGETVSYWL